MIKIFGRHPSRYIKRIPEIPQYIGYLLKCFLLFKNPLRFIWAYFSETSLPQRLVELRNGLKIHLSEHPHDIITVFVIFVREDYGEILPGSTVVDIGANIGVFSLYAASRKAARVFAYEPNSESYQYLLNNIAANDLQKVIVPQQLAVTSADGETVKFPTKASMYNAIITDESRSDYEFVATISLPTVLGAAEKIEVLKLDCEGAEYDILFNSRLDALLRVMAIRMEYHSGRVQELESALRPYGFSQHHLSADTSTSGNVWYQRV